MELREQTIIEVQGDNFEKFESKINTEKLSKLYGMLSSLYRNIYGSIVREYCANAWDSHKEAGRENEPIYIKLHQETDNNYLLIKDVGLGMSPEVMQNIYFNYLDSTKEDTNEYLGAFGIGGKSALAYTHTFYIDTISEGILYHYIFSKQSNGIPAGELLYEESTTEHNGTTIKIPVKENDLKYFHNELDKQLTYFPNVYVESDWGSFDNDYTIYDKPLYKYRPDSGLSEIHLALGDVPYTIDWTELGMRAIYIPIAIKFNIGELTPTPSRESIVYSKESIKIIKDKINTILSSFVKEYNSSIKDVDTIADYIKYKRNDSYVYIRLTEDKALPVKTSYLDGLKDAEIKKLKGLIKSKTIVTNFAMDYKFVDFYVAGETGYKRNSDKYMWGSVTSNVESYLNKSYLRFYILKGDLDNKKNLWLSYEDSYKDIYFIKPIKKSLDSYIKYLGLKKKDKANWRYIIKTFQELSEEYFTSKMLCYDDLEISQEWLDNYEDTKKAKLQEVLNRRKEEKKIVYYQPGSSYQKNFKWVKEEDTIKAICNSSKNIVYVETKDKKLSMAMYELLKSLKLSDSKWNVITTAISHHKHFKEQPHMIEYNELLRTKHPLLIKIATAKYIENNLTPNVFVECDKFKYINKDIQQKMSFLLEYKK